MVGSTLTGFDAYLKDNYTKDEVGLLVNEDHNFLDDLDTARRGTGRRWIVPIIDANAQGLGATVPDAQFGAEQTQGGNIQGAAWTVNWGDYSVHVDIGDKVMAASASDMGAFFEDKKAEIDSLYRAWGDTFSSYMLRDAGHSLGSGTNAGGVQTLVNKADVVNFERGMTVIVSANDGTSTAHVILAGALTGYVVNTNYAAGTFTVSATSGGAAGTPTNWAGTMFYFRGSQGGTGSATGDFGGSASPNRIILGFGAWNPAADPTSTAFEGVDRTLDIVRRSGIRLVAADVAGLGIEQRAKKLVVRMASRGKRPKNLYLHPEQWQALADSLEGRGNRPIGDGGKFNFMAIQLATPAGMVSIKSDRFMPIDACYALDPDAIRFASLDGFPKIVNGDGLTMLRKSNANVYEYRLATYPAYVHRLPPATGRCPLLIPS